MNELAESREKKLINSSVGGEKKRGEGMHDSGD